jgi:hypothetical protein
MATGATAIAVAVNNAAASFFIYVFPFDNPARRDYRANPPGPLGIRSSFKSIIYDLPRER